MHPVVPSTTSSSIVRSVNNSALAKSVSGTLSAWAGIETFGFAATAATTTFEVTTVGGLISATALPIIAATGACLLAAIPARMIWASRNGKQETVTGSIMAGARMPYDLFLLAKKKMSPDAAIVTVEVTEEQELEKQQNVESPKDEADSPVLSMELSAEQQIELLNEINQLLESAEGEARQDLEKFRTDLETGTVLLTKSVLDLLAGQLKKLKDS